jgi:hypothetical protein
VSQYKTDVSKNVSPQVLSSLARQIASAANAIGQRVSLPNASGGAASAPSASPARPSTESGKLNVTA